MRNHSRDDQCEEDDDHEGEEGDCRVERAIHKRKQYMKEHKSLSVDNLIWSNQTRIN